MGTQVLSPDERRDASLSRLAESVLLSVAIHLSAFLAIGAAGGFFPGPLAPSVPQFPRLDVSFGHRVPAPPSPEPAAAAPLPDVPPAVLTPEPVPVAQPPRSAEPERSLLPVEPPRYYRASELSLRPRPLDEIDVAYPESNVAASGKVVLRVMINAAGRVDRVEVDASELPQAFRAAAVEAFGRARYAPGERDGVPVNSEMKVEVSFDAGEPPPAGMLRRVP